MSTAWAELSVGEVVAEQTFSLTRDSLVRYAGASGDFNPIHYRDDAATQVGLEGVLAHGMLTMGLAVQPLITWLGGSGFVKSYQVRFTKPVYVPASGAMDVTVRVTVAKLGEPEADDITMALQVTTAEGASVLGKAFVVVSPL
jgi:acyl dehydratase